MMNKKKENKKKMTMGKRVDVHNVDKTKGELVKL